MPSVATFARHEVLCKYAVICGRKRKTDLNIGKQHHGFSNDTDSECPLIVLQLFHPEIVLFSLVFASVL